MTWPLDLPWRARYVTPDQDRDPLQVVSLSRIQVTLVCGFLSKRNSDHAMLALPCQIGWSTWTRRRPDETRRDKKDPVRPMTPTHEPVEHSDMRTQRTHKTIPFLSSPSLIPRIPVTTIHRVRSTQSSKPPHVMRDLGRGVSKLK